MAASSRGCRQEPVTRPCVTDARNRAIYDRLYKQVCRKMVRQLQPLYREIAAITGYPQHF
jgi:hypothetical protein